MSDQTENGGRVPDDAPAADERSGSDAADAVETAAGEGHDGVQTAPDAARSGEAPVEQVGGDEEMTAQRTVGAPGTAEGEGPEGVHAPPEEAPVSGGAQDAPGARASDRVAGADGQESDDGTAGQP